MSSSDNTWKYRTTEATEPQPFQLYISLYDMSVNVHWGLVLKDSTGYTALLDANEHSGTRAHQVRNFDEVSKNRLRALCHVAQLGDDDWVQYAKSVAAAVDIPPDNDSSFCRTWVMNVLKSLQEQGLEQGFRLSDTPERIQSLVQAYSGDTKTVYKNEYKIAVLSVKET
ncbi:hypothetical protein HD806DRAFT_528615 [Xylariaceae sp. AK1471]|nr:hypothetical protein HD806DRAFT_528615 [Xylariaceae sp. AK1471]